MRYIEEESVVSPLWYVLGGAIVGAGLGVLFAPKVGKEIRQDIGDWSRNNSLMSRISAMIPTRVKVAAGIGAARSGGREAYRETKERVKRSFES